MSKRRCTGIPDPAEIVNLSDDSDDLVEKPKSTVVLNGHKGRRKSSFADTLKKALPNSNPEYLGPTSEYTRVENRIRSKEYTKYRAVNQHMAGVNPRKRPEIHYRGTARPTQRAEVADTSSRYWRAEIPGQSNPRDTFRDVNGRKRGSSSSEDELVSNGPSDNYTSMRRAVSPDKSTSKAAIVPDSQENNHDMEFEKDIRKTNFSNLSKSASKNPSRKKIKRLNPTSCKFHIKGIVSNSFRRIDLPSCLNYQVINDQNDVLIVSIQDDDGLTKTGLTIPARVIHTVVWNTESPIAHLKCSKAFDHPDTVMDIEFVDEDSCGQFVAIIAERGSAQTKTSDRCITTLNI